MSSDVGNLDPNVHVCTQLQSQPVHRSSPRMGKAWRSFRRNWIGEGFLAMGDYELPGTCASHADHRQAK